MLSLFAFEFALIIAAVAVNGILAGISVGRSLIELPAWRSVNLAGFHDYVQTADLGRGIVFYPAIGIVATALVIATAIVGTISSLPLIVVVLLIVSAILSLLHSATTSRAAPNMLSLRNSALSKEEVKVKFDLFKKWHDRRAALQLSTFLSILLALAAVI